MKYLECVWIPARHPSSSNGPWNALGPARPHMSWSHTVTHGPASLSAGSTNSLWVHARTLKLNLSPQVAYAVVEIMMNIRPSALSDVSGRVPTPVMGREMLQALLLNKTSHGQWPYVTVQTRKLPKSKDYSEMLNKSPHGHWPYVTVLATYYNHQIQTIIARFNEAFMFNESTNISTPHRRHIITRIKFCSWNYWGASVKQELI